MKRMRRRRRGGISGDAKEVKKKKRIFGNEKFQGKERNSAVLKAVGKLAAVGCISRLSASCR